MGPRTQPGIGSGRLVKISVVLCVVCAAVAGSDVKETPKIQAGGWKPIVTDPKTGKNITVKMTEKELLTKAAPKGVDGKKTGQDLKTDRSGRLLIAEQGNSASNAFYVWLPTDILNMDNRQQGNRHGGGFRGSQDGPSFRNGPSGNGHFNGPPGPPPAPAFNQGPPQQQQHSGRHSPNYLPDQGADVQPGGVRIYSGFRPIPPPSPAPQHYNRPQAAYQPPPGAAPNPVQHQQPQDGPQTYVPQQEIPRPNPQSYHGPRAENGPQFRQAVLPQHNHGPPPPQHHNGPPPQRPVGPPPQHHGPPQEHHGHPPQHHGPPPQHHGPPPQHHGPPPQHHGPPPQHHGPPPQHHRPAPPQHHGPPQQYHGPPPQHYHAPLPPPPQPIVNQPPPPKAPSGGGYGVPDLDDEDDLPEPGYGSAPRPAPPPAPQPGYGSAHRRPSPEYNQSPPPQFGNAPPPQPPPQPSPAIPSPPPPVERGYGAPPRRPSSYGQPAAPPPPPQQYKPYDATPRPIGIVSARPQPPPYVPPPQQQPPQQPPQYSRPIPVDGAPVVRPVGGGGYGRPEPFEEDDFPATRPVRPVTVAPSTEFFPGTAAPVPRKPTPDEEAGVGVIEPRSLGTCAAKTDVSVRSTSGLRDIASELQADLVFNEFGVSEADLSSAAGQDGQYTIFLPANEARLFTNPELFSMWRSDRDALMRTLANHVIAGQIPLSQLRRGGSFVSKNGQNSILNARGHDDGVVTVNGQRVIYADINVPNGGLLHIVGGFLHPIADKDIIPLVQECGKYDGFVTLAAGTGFNQELQGSPDGYTLFLPSNDALSKVPKDELEVIRTNTTALREFLRYHAAEGIHYSHDLRDGQYLTSLQNGAPLRVSVNTDGCRRRLYEVNNSPLYRADIPAANGVVHVIDWVLLPSDHRWCNNVILP